MKYAWKETARLRRVDAQKVGKEMELLKRQGGGRFTPGDVVNAARSVGTELHKCFEWDDTKAAEQYRLAQAGFLIRKLVVQIAEEGADSEPVRAFVSIDGLDEGPRFYHIRDAMADSDLRRLVLQEALEELKDFRKRYARYQELAAVFEAIDKISA